VNGTMDVRYDVIDCLLYDPTKPFANSGSTIPIKLQLCDALKNNLSSDSIEVKAIEVTLIATSSGVPQDAGKANPNEDFRNAAGGYLYNLKTTDDQGNPLTNGSYTLSIKVGTDPKLFIVPFQLK
jgi:hypothetical protein